MTTEINNSRIDAKSTVRDDIEKNSPVTKPVITPLLSIYLITIKKYCSDPDIDYKRRSNNGIILRWTRTNH